MFEIQCIPSKKLSSLSTFQKASKEQKARQWKQLISSNVVQKKEACFLATLKMAYT